MWIRRAKYDELRQDLRTVKRENSTLEDEKRERDKMISIERKKNKELQDKINDLENNIEFLYNNLSAAKKKQIKKEASEPASNKTLQ